MTSPRDRAGLVGYALLALALVALCALRKTSDWDTYWHLRAGQQALADGNTVPVDLLSFSHPGTPWPFKDLLAEIILYGAFAKLGHAGFALLRALCAALAALGIFLSQPPPRRASAPVFVACGLLFCATAYRYADRPLLFSLGFSPLYLALLQAAFRAAASELQTPWTIYSAFLPVLLCQALWLQLHREGMTGLVLLTGFALYLSGAALVHQLPLLAPLRRLLATRPTPQTVAAAWLTLALAIASGLLHPCGTALYRTSIAALGQMGAHQALIAEWQPLPLGQLLTTAPLTTLLCLGSGAGLVYRLWLAPPREADVFHLGAWLLFVLQTRGSIRWLHFLAEVSALMTLLLLLDLGAALRARGQRPPRGLRWLLIAGFPLVLAQLPLNPLGVGDLPAHYPAEALAFARRNHLNERVHNAFPFGGYLVYHGWPRFRVLVDGRNEQLYPLPFMFACNQAERDPAAFARLSAAYPADWVLAGNKPEARSHTFLARDPAWALVFRSDAASIYVRRSAYPQLLANELRHVPKLARGRTPVQVLAQARTTPDGAAALVRELQRVTEDAPGDLPAHTWLAQVYDALGETAKRDETLRRLYRERPDLLGITAEP